MTSFKSFFLISLAFALCSWHGTWPLRGQTTANVSAIVQFSNGQSVTVTDFSNLVGIQPNEMVSITIQFPAALAGQPVTAQTIDGGTNSIGSNITVAGDDGSITFAFVGTANPGRNSVAIQAGSTSVLLQLWVIDSANPQNNPSGIITASNG